MSRLRTLGPTPAFNHPRSKRVPLLAALAALTFLAAPPPARAQTVTVTITDLNPTGFYQSTATGVSGNTQVGYDRLRGSSFAHALLWHSTADSVVDLHPAGLLESYATGVSGNTQVGRGYDADEGYEHALLWHGTASSVVDLGTGTFGNAAALDADGNSQVGTGYDTYYDSELDGYLFTGDDHALLWHGTADSVVDLGNAGLTFVEATGVSGDMQVGTGYDEEEDGDGDAFRGPPHALLWHGTADSVVELTPAGFTNSEAYGIDGNSQVGTGYHYPSDSFYPTLRHAFLWHGTAASAVDLNPTGYNGSEALGVSGDVQVGYGYKADGYYHALLWRGTAATVLDLNKFLPAGYTAGPLQSVSGSGNVYDAVGIAFAANYYQHAVLWHVVFDSKPVIQHLYPASRTVGRDAFTLTVAGTGFTAASQVQWNGAAQTTAFVNATTLTASIPGALIAQAGTAQVSVRTPGVGTSNSHVETVMPRPTVTSLSPASKKAGSGAFTLSVTGTGFRPASFYAPTVVKWNGMELATSYVSDTKLTASVPASLVARTGTAQVTVTTPQVATTSPKTFIITP